MQAVSRIKIVMCAWSLDNVEVTVQYENCTRSVLSEDFEDMK